MKSSAAIDRFSAFEGGARRVDYAGNRVVASRPAPAPAKIRPPDPPGLLLGELEDAAGAVAVDLRQLLEGRLLIQGVSGAGKSWTLRRLVEQAHGQVQVIVIDPEGEYGSLAATLGILHIAAHRLDPAALRSLALRCREQRASVVLDLSDCDRTQQMIAIAPFLEGLVEAPREHWHPCLVAIDEAHLFAPFGGHSTAEPSVRKAAIGAVVDVMGRGRKRGLAGVLATQRLARLAKSVSSEVSNFLVGGNTQDLDIKRAAEQIGWEARKASDRLPLLQPGEFVAVGRAFSTQPAQVKIGGVRSEHRGASPAIAAPPATTADNARELLGLEELLAQSAEEEGDDQRLQVGARGVRRFIRDGSFVLAARAYGALKALSPDGVLAANLAAHLEADPGELVEALALLEQHGAVQFTAAGAAGPVAVPASFLNPRGGQ